MEVIIGDPDRLCAVVENFIKHYETRVAECATVQFLNNAIEVGRSAYLRLGQLFMRLFAGLL